MKNLLAKLAKKLYTWQVRRGLRRAGLPEAAIQQMEFQADQNRLTVVAEHPAVMDLAAGLVTMFDAIGGTNYVELQIGTQRGPFVVTVRPLSGKTPGDVVADLRQNIQYLESQLNIVADAMARWAEVGVTSETLKGFAQAIDTTRKAEDQVLADELAAIWAQLKTGVGVSGSVGLARRVRELIRQHGHTPELDLLFREIMQPYNNR